MNNEMIFGLWLVLGILLGWMIKPAVRPRILKDASLVRIRNEEIQASYLYTKDGPSGLFFYTEPNGTVLDANGNIVGEIIRGTWNIEFVDGYVAEVIRFS